MDLCVVIPVYNEAACIAGVVEEWIATLGRVVGSYQILVLDDGSTDDTPAALSAFAGHTSVRVIRKTNEGHGPTLLKGYGEAVQVADWVFQVDGDNEMPPEAFPELWQARNDYDFVFGVRTGRRQPPGRLIITLCSRVIVRVLCGRGVTDVNVPYRLMRGESLRCSLPGIPNDTFAPNVAIAGLAIREKHRLLNLPVPHRERETGQPSLIKWSLVRCALLSLVQTVRILRSRRS